MKKRLATAILMSLLLSGANIGFAAPSEDYSAELNALKQRMAELEAKMQASDTKGKDKTKAKTDDKFKFSGDFRVRSVWSGGPATFEERVRLALTNQVNDNTTFYVRWAVMNNNQMGTTARYNDVLPNNSTDDDMSAQDRNIVSDAYMRVDNLFGTKNSVTLGRFGQDIGATNYWNSAGNIGLIDGIKFDTKVNDLKATIGFANWSALASAKKSGVNRTLQNAMFVNASYKLSEPTTLYWTYVKETNSSDSPINFQVTGPGIRARLSDNWSFRGDYLRNYAEEGNPLGEYYSLMYKGANDQKPHSWGVSLDYHYVQPNNVAYTLATGIQMQPSGDIKGPGMTAHYSPDKNCMVDFYQTFNTRKASTGERTNNYSRIQVVYGF